MSHKIGRALVPAFRYRRKNPLCALNRRLGWPEHCVEPERPIASPPMWPIAFESDVLRIGSYGVIVGVGILACLWLARSLGRRDGYDPRVVNDIGIAVFVGGFIGSKLLGLVVDVARGAPVGLAELRTAGAIHGGLLGGLAAFWLASRWFRVTPFRLLDAYVPAVALGQAIGRLGCFAAGCCFGAPSSAPWAVVFHDSVAHELGGVPLGVSLHPVQVYDAALHLVLFGLLWALHRRRAFEGALLGPWAILEGIIRLTVEGFRGDPGRGVWGGLPWLSTGRLTASVFVVLGVMVVLHWLRTSSEPSGPPSRAQR